MSLQELAHLFPSATHPALPVASEILSTLRALTAPGKGNNLRAEERPALVGIAALLGCERVQSHDLAPAAVQRAMSVSPARFKSAMATSRALLESNAASASPSSSRRSQPSTPSSSRVSTMPAPTPPAIRFDPTSPFMTPRKKFRATSTKDVSGLLTPHKHSPAASSPLRAATTPRKRPVDEGDAEATPSKRVQTAEAGRDDDEEVGGDPQTPSRRASARAAAKAREREGAAAFLAMRPGSQPAKEMETEEREEMMQAAPLASVDLQAEIDAVLGRRSRRRLRARRDWTFREDVWAPKRGEMARILAAAGESTGEDKDTGKSPKRKEDGDFDAHIVAVVLAASS